jgi:predicted AAA+ superfamily ATPase
LEQVLCALRPKEAYLWATQSGAEVDLLFFSEGQRFGVECKFNEAPRVTKSMHGALNDLDLRHLWVIHPGSTRYPAHEKITMLPLADIATLKAEVARASE